ncbi:CotH kinase family protein [Streptomyces sp. DSM 44915]|uniref:CotH kinase family protein n=1 Tax=Streptomyces chisholmiae TaxID=3075540 RepID=A0ABU2K0D4_9ACTN|nr:CotH kinase family protein [Streptomyces sp. DSM 44915]MDT0270716.1 CotH kinase family protein [Streptomyces sp. DSM 44915]
MRGRNGRRVRHLLPTRLRRHWRLVTLACAAVLVLTVAVGEFRVRPYVSSRLVSQETVTQNIEGEGDLFDGGEHRVELTFNEDEYAEALRVFREEGEKEYIQADIVIDGTTVQDVGLRLKGNSTLMSLRSSGDSSGVGPGGEGPGGMGPGGTTLSEEEPENLPWLISFDEFQTGRAYQGHTEIALRPGTSTSATALNEALALSLTAADGQTTQDHTFTSVSVNGGDAVPRLLLESPDEPWAAELGEGVLYKARAGGSFDYLGDDPTAYEDAFRQVNDDGGHDLTPVTALLRFVAEADDEEFAARLPEYLDVDSFARYLATQSLLANNDAMDGPGNNYYLWYDTEEERFTVLSWDLNLSFGGLGGGFGAGPGGAAGDEETFPEDGQVPGGGQLPGGMEPPGGGQGTGGGLGGSGALKERFLADDEFTARYEAAYAELYQELIADGTAQEILDSVVAQAERAGDEGAAEAGEQLAEQLAAVAETPAAESTLRPGGAGREATDGTATG